MTIGEALKESKENGKCYARPDMSGGWVIYKESYSYSFVYEDLVATDWEKQN